jgi:glycine/D-amino acid oxidase-like deaminating enzyme
VGRRRPGIASIAAAGFLAPTIDPVRGAALPFTLAARDGYPDFVRELTEVTRRELPFALDGILRIPSDEREAARMARDGDSRSQWITSSDVLSLEPSLHAPLGARWHPGDGMVDNQRLMAALDDAVAAAGIPRLDAEGARVELVGDQAALILADGRRLRCRRLVLAAGAWAPLVDGLPRPLPVRPLRGQMMSLRVAPPAVTVTRPVFGHGGYLIPRALDAQVIVGSTSEAVGYAVGTTDEALTTFRAIAATLVPALARADEVRTWSGLRPMTLDALPILGADPDAPALIYACGHSRNGILLAPLTGTVVAALAAGDDPGHDLSPFAISRFSRGTAVLA